MLSIERALDSIWVEATLAERQILIEDLVDSVRFYPDRLTVEVVGAPPILVTLKEVGLHTGTRSMVSETRRNRHHPLATGAAVDLIGVLGPSQ